MPRKGEVKRRDILPDPKFHDRTVTKFINAMLVDGKKSLAERILYEALAIVGEHRVDELGDGSIVKLGIGKNVPTLDFTFPWHGGSVHRQPRIEAATVRRRSEDHRPHLGLFAPYFDRP